MKKVISIKDFSREPDKHEFHSVKGYNWLFVSHKKEWDVFAKHEQSFWDFKPIGRLEKVWAESAIALVNRAYVQFKDVLPNF